MNTWKTADAVVRCLEDLEVEPRVRDDAGGWAR